MGGRTAKQFLELGGRPILAATLAALLGTGFFRKTVVPVPEKDLEKTRTLIDSLGLAARAEAIAGGVERTDSVRRGIERLGELGAGEADLVAVHDGVRPLVSGEIVERVLRAAIETGAAVAAVPVKDTVKVARDGFVEETPDRSNLWLVQTPQVFRFGLLAEAYARALADGRTPATDDAALVERLGGKVRVVEGDYENIKITTPEDLLIAEALLSRGR